MRDIKLRVWDKENAFGSFEALAVPLDLSIFLDLRGWV
jgi:hypothetical protein